MLSGDTSLYIQTGRVSYSERQMAKMLARQEVWFRQHAFVAGREVDFLIPRPGRRGLLIEVDGDIFHLDAEARRAKDRQMTREGWEVIHFWASEVLQTPRLVEKAVEAALDGVPRMPPEEAVKKRKIDKRVARAYA